MWVGVGFFCLVGWAILLKGGYRIIIFTVAYFHIFPGLEQVHKKGKCHNGYSTSF